MQAGHCIMQFTTPVDIHKSRETIDHKSKLMLLGSCFAQNIGQRLAQGKFDICINPFGIIYNPLSIATVLKRIAKGTPFTEHSPEIFEYAERWHSTLHHSDFSRKTKEELLCSINQSLQEAHERIKEVNYIVITFGTAYAYEQANDSSVVSNCHKLPANCFNRRLLNTEEATNAMEEAMQTVVKQCPDAKFIFTVSPIRHLRDGAHDNQKSKATLLLVADELQKRFPDNSEYFPAYEIMMDELRDYRFYADDMTHPSPIAVEYIWKKFANSHINTASLELCREIEDIYRALGHRPFDTTSDAYKNFLQNTAKKITGLKERHPYLNFEKEIERCNIPLSK